MLQPRSRLKILHLHPLTLWQIVDSALISHVLQLVNTLFFVWHGSFGYFMLRPFIFIGLNALDVPAETFRL